MVLIKINNKSISTAFFFNALFTAVTFAVILVFNDYTIDSYFSNGKRQGGLAISILRL